MLADITFILKIFIAVYCGYIFSEHCTKAGMIFNRLYLLSEENLPTWLHKPFIGCFRCVCGQWAMWAYLVQTTFYHASDFKFLNMIAAGFVGVGVSLLLHKIHNDE